MKFPNIGNFNLKGGYKSGRIEKGFERELLTLLRKCKNYICFHPADVGLANKFLDVHFITEEGYGHWIELKKINGYTFNVKKFEDDQVFLLKQLDKINPEIARVGIYSVALNEYKILKFSEIWKAQNEKGGVKIFDK